MLTDRFFERFQNTISKAEIAFGQYQKYTTCFSIQTIDEEMETIFRRIKLSYAKLAILIQDDGVGDGTKSDMINTIDMSDKIIVESSVFFQGINEFLRINRKDIINLLGNNEQSVQIGAEVVKLETQLQLSQKIVSRMELMLRGSQQIFLGAELDRKIA